MTDYEFYKRMGVCPRCKEKSEKTVLCKRCSEIANEYTKAHRRMLVSIGICPVCRKESLHGNNKQCDSCRMTDCETVKKYRRKLNRKQKSLYKQRSKDGICTRCGKSEALSGKKKCQICLEKDREWHRLKK